MCCLHLAISSDQFFMGRSSLLNLLWSVLLLLSLFSGVLLCVVGVVVVVVVVVCVVCVVVFLLIIVPVLVTARSVTVC